MLEHRYKFGRKARRSNPRVPHLSALLAASTNLRPVPEKVDYTLGMPDDFGMMLNDRIGDCVCAAFYHARQIYTFNAQFAQITEPDRDVEKLYIEACGYNPLIPIMDPGCNVQEVLNVLLTTGAPIGTNGIERHKILGFIEVDSKKKADVKRAIYECGVVMIGFPVPSTLDVYSTVWDFDPQAYLTRDGHAVILAGFDEKGATAISWGRRYQLTWDFILNVVDECYAMVDSAWIKMTGLTPAGLSLAELEEQMQALKMADMEEIARRFGGLY